MSDRRTYPGRQSRVLVLASSDRSLNVDTNYGIRKRRCGQPEYTIPKRGKAHRPTNHNGRYWFTECGLMLEGDKVKAEFRFTDLRMPVPTRDRVCDTCAYTGLVFTALMAARQSAEETTK